MSFRPTPCQLILPALGLALLGACGGENAAPPQGASWTYHWSQLEGIDGGIVHHLLLVPGQPPTLYTLTDRNELLRQQGSEPWLPSQLKSKPFLVLAHPKSLELYAIDLDHGVYSSLDGVQWEKRSTFNTNQSLSTLALDPQNPQVLYAGSVIGPDTAQGGVSRSTDGGRSWSTLGLDDYDITAIAVDPSNAQVLYAGAANQEELSSNFNAGGIFKSLDGGLHWSFFGLKEKNVMGIYIDARKPRTVYASTDLEGIFKSEDGGRRWRPINQGLQFSHSQFFGLPLALDPSSADTLYCGTFGNGAFKSTDAGEHWKPLAIPGASLLIEALAVDPGAPGSIYAGTWETGVFRSTDGGATWASYNKGFNNADVLQLEIPSQPSAPFYAIRHNVGLVRSLDQGNSWQVWNNRGLLNPRKVRDLTLNPKDPSNLYLVSGSEQYGNSNILLKSLDGGLSWQAIQFEDTKSIQTFRLDPAAPQTLYLILSEPGPDVPNYGLYKSTNAGQTWTHLETPIQLNYDSGLWVASTQGSSNLLLASSPPPIGSNVQLFQSADGGSSWDQSTTPFQYVYDLELVPTAPNLLYATIYSERTSYGVFLSQDRGKTWGDVGLALTKAWSSHVLPIPGSSSSLYAFSGEGGVLRSDDRGESWTPIQTGLPSLHVPGLKLMPGDSNKIFALIGSGYSDYAQGIWIGTGQPAKP